MIVTLDYNCIIALENGEEPRATILRELAQACHRYDHTLAVYSHLVLENRPPNSERHEASNFTKRLEDLDVGVIETIAPSMNTQLIELVNSILFPRIPFSWSSYLTSECDKAGIAFEAMQEANRDREDFRFPATPAEAAIPLPDTLTPNAKQELRMFWDKKYKKWNNSRSDVLALCAHIMRACDGIFVTVDIDDFVHNRDKLRSEVTKVRIMTPAEALHYISMEGQKDSILMPLTTERLG